jgi:FkbM family methyltransferase
VRGRVLHRETLARVGQRSVMVAEIDRQSSSAAYANPYDFRPMTAWRALLRPGDLFIDVGASVGVYSLWVRELGARVVAVEPSPDAVSRLRRNLELSGADEVEVLEVALSDADGELLMTRYLDATNHILLEAATGVAKTYETQVVRSTTLDHVLGDRHAAGVKVDVEGAELLVVQGASRALAEHRVDTLQLEWNELSLRTLGSDRSALLDLLREHGYRTYRPDASGRLQPVSEPSLGDDVFARHAPPPEGGAR